MPEQSGYQALKQISSSDAGAAMLDRYGLTEKVLIEKYLLPLLNARVTKHFVVGGKLVARTMKDNSTCLQAVDRTFRIRGDYTDVKEAVQVPIRSVVINMQHRPPQPPPKFEPPDISAPGVMP